MAEETAGAERAAAGGRGPLVYRQTLVTRLSHWVWALCLFFLLLSGLQIFNAHPALYIGDESGFEYRNAVLEIYASMGRDGVPAGHTVLFGHEFTTTGVLGVSGPAERPSFQAFPGAVTIPSYRDLATGRVVHFFFAWIFVGALFAWFLGSFLNGHMRRDLVPGAGDLRELPRDAGRHALGRFGRGRGYGPVQKLSYFLVLFILFPLIVLSGLALSPGMNATAPFLIDLFGGRQTARTVHFLVMILLVLFFIVHMIMVLVSGPLNGLRAMITGWYRTGPETPRRTGDRP